MDDYRKNGLLYCGKCHTPKECKVDVMGEPRIVTCMCVCQADMIEQERIRHQEKERQAEIIRNRAEGIPDKDMREHTFERDDARNEQVRNICLQYTTHFPDRLKDGKGLLLYGSVGVGKTFYGGCIVNALIDKGYMCLMTTFPRLVNDIQASYSERQERIDRLRAYQLLVIDDLGVERNTEYMAEMVQTIIDERYRSGLPLIITTNLSPEELKNPGDVTKGRLYSRLFEMCIPVKVEGADRRREKLVKDYNQLREELHLPRG